MTQTGSLIATHSSTKSLAVSTTALSCDFSKVSSKHMSAARIPVIEKRNVFIIHFGSPVLLLVVVATGSEIPVQFKAKSRPPEGAPLRPPWENERKKNTQGACHALNWNFGFLIPTLDFASAFAKLQTLAPPVKRKFSAIHLHPNGKAMQCRYGWRIPLNSLIDVFINFGFEGRGRRARFNNTTVMSYNHYGVSAAPLGDVGTSWAAPVALSYLIYLKNRFYGEDAPLTDELIAELKQRLTPRGCFNWQQSGVCKLQDPLKFYSHEVYRLNYLIH